MTHPAAILLTHLGKPPAFWDRIVASFIVFVLIIGLWWQWLRNTVRSRTVSLPPLDLALTLLLLFSPVVNNWYWCWVLPLAVALRRGWLVAACTSGCLAYINGATLLEVDWSIGHELAWFEVPFFLTVLQLLLILLPAIFFHRGHDLRFNRKSRQQNP